jgi:His-Xaa-Ser system protein HxsD
MPQKKKKTVRAAKKAAPRKTASRLSFAPLSVCLRLAVTREGGLEPILGAAYLLTDRAFVMLSGDRARTLCVRLRPKKDSGKKALETLAREFEAELESQKLRWAIAKNNQPVREYLAEQAVLLAQGHGAPPPPAEPAGDQLSDAQRDEIAKLIAEVEDEIKTMNQKKAQGAAPAAADPKNIKASWEEKQQSGAAPARED